MCFNLMWQPEGSRVWGRMDIHIYIYMAESLCFSPETITTLLIGYIPTQNKKLKKKKGKIKRKRKKSMC